MKTLVISGVAALLGILLCPSAFGQAMGQHGVFKATVTIPVVRVENAGATQKYVTKTLTSNDLINLAQGRALGSTIDKTKEVLAADVTFEESGGVTPPESRLVIYDPSVGGAGGVKVVVGKLTEVKFLTTYSTGATKGVGIGKTTLEVTTLGEPTKHGIIEGTFTGTAKCSGGHIFNKGANVTPAGSAAFSGTCSFRFTTVNAGVPTTTVWDGLVLKGAAKISGKPIGNYVVP